MLGVGSFGVHGNEHEHESELGPETEHNHENENDIGAANDSFNNKTTLPPTTTNPLNGCAGIQHWLDGMTLTPTALPNTNTHSTTALTPGAFFFAAAAAPSPSPSTAGTINNSTTAPDTSAFAPFFPGIDLAALTGLAIDVSPEAIFEAMMRREARDATPWNDVHSYDYDSGFDYVPPAAREIVHRDRDSDMHVQQPRGDNLEGRGMWFE